MKEDVMKFIILDQGEGKTTKLIKWVKQGHEINTWPYWSRIIITHTMQNADLLRNTMRKEHGMDRIGLDYHQVFFLGEWQNRGQGAQRESVEVGLDNADLVLQEVLGDYTKLSVVTATGEFEEGGTSHDED
jgi:hypothetical protein